ncbi:MAG: transposase [Proteobacteria bacterium]|nr:transposase [Pseudomonadota bacterium]
MVKILRETDKTPVAQAAEQYGISEQTLYVWRKPYGKLEAADVKELRTLPQENARLKKLLAERDLAIEVMKEISAKNGECARPPATGEVGARAWPVGSKYVRADAGFAIDAELQSAASGEGRTDDCSDARVVDAVSALWSSAHWCIRGMRRSPDELGWWAPSLGQV